MSKQRDVIAELRKYLKKDPELIYSLIPQLPEEQQEPTRMMCVILESGFSPAMEKMLFQILDNKRDIQTG